MIDTEVCEVVIPEADKILSPFTFNNRKGMGSQAAINQLMEHIYEVTEGYTKPARIVKIDFSGYFPNAVWLIAEKCIDEVIDRTELDEETKAYLKWLTMISVHCNPAAHCELRTASHLWREHIAPEIHPHQAGRYRCRHRQIDMADSNGAVRQRRDTMADGRMWHQTRVLCR